MHSFQKFIHEAECQMGLNRSVKRNALALKKRLLQRLMRTGGSSHRIASLQNRMKSLRDQGRNI